MVGEEETTLLAKSVRLFWLVAVLIFTSSYTASLSSILIEQQQQQQSPTIRNFADLKRSKVSIGCQKGSFTFNYLQNTLFIPSNRLVNLVTEEDYDNALKSGNLSAIIDESPYLETFLTSTGCKYKIVDSNIGYFGGFSFVSISHFNLSLN